MEECYGMAAEWINGQLSDDFAVDIFNDFGIGIKASEDVKNLITMAQSGKLSHGTLLQEMKRRGILADEIDTELEAELAQAEADGALMGPMPEDLEQEA